MKTKQQDRNALHAEPGCSKENRFNNYVPVSPTIVTYKTKRGWIAAIIGTGFGSIVRVVREKPKDAINDVIVLAARR